MKQFQRKIFENEACLVINKLPGECSQSPDVETDGKKFPVPVHRLDMPVSGCLLLARTSVAAAFLGAAFAQGRVTKRYWAVVEKPHGASPMELSPDFVRQLHWLSFDKAKNKSFAHNEAGRGRKKAELRYRLAGRGENYLFLEIELLTGRHHQIRAQLAALGLHVKGDLKYGARRSEKNGGIRLHAYCLAFPNPLNPDETIEVKALPQSMDTLWTAFCGISDSCHAATI